jgi:hypothetical protein
MFVIQPENAADWQHALYILSHYKELVLNVYSDAEKATSTYMVVDDNDCIDSRKSVHQVESAFQINWNQDRMICPHCENVESPCMLCDIYSDCGDHGSENCRPNTCGHLTFNKPINSDAFDRIFE